MDTVLTPAVCLQQLTKDYRLPIKGRKLRAVDRLTLEIPEKSIFGFLGPNGAGKSSTIRIILGLTRPTRGTARIFGFEPGSLMARRSIGYLPEAPYFHRFLTGHEWLELNAKLHQMHRSEREKRILDVLNTVKLTNAATRRIGSYSKGMLQRIGLAAAIIHRPRLLVLDEPTAGLDPTGTADIATLIRELNASGTTILLCSHLLAEVQDLCDRVAILNHGKLLTNGPLDELLLDPQTWTLSVEGFRPQLKDKTKAELASIGIRLAAVEPRRKALAELFNETVERGTNTLKPDISQE